MGWAGRAYLQAWWVGPPGILAGPSVSKVGPPGMGRGPPEARRPAWFALVFPLSVFGREPRAGSFKVGGPATDTVRARLPIFGFRARTSGREFQGWRPGGRHGSRSTPHFRFPGANPGPGDFGVGGPATDTVRARLPASPLFSVFGREPRAEDFGVGGPAAALVRARRPAFGFRARTSGREFRGWRPVVFSRARFAPRSLLTLAAPFRGAKSSHNSRADAGGRRIKKHLVGLSGKVLPSLPQFACGQRSCPQVFPAILPQGHAISRECFHLIK